MSVEIKEKIDDLEKINHNFIKKEYFSQLLDLFDKGEDLVKENLPTDRYNINVDKFIEEFKTHITDGMVDLDFQGKIDHHRYYSDFGADRDYFYNEILYDLLDMSKKDIDNGVPISQSKTVDLLKDLNVAYNEQYNSELVGEAHVSKYTDDTYKNVLLRMAFMAENEEDLKNLSQKAGTLNIIDAEILGTPRGMLNQSLVSNNIYGDISDFIKEIIFKEAQKPEALDDIIFYSSKNDSLYSSVVRDLVSQFDNKKLKFDSSNLSYQKENVDLLVEDLIDRTKYGRSEEESFLFPELLDKMGVLKNKGFSKDLNNSIQKRLEQADNQRDDEEVYTLGHIQKKISELSETKKPTPPKPKF